MENTNRAEIFFRDGIFYFEEHSDIVSALLCSVGAECKKQGSAPRSHLARSWLCSGGAEQSAEKKIRSTEQICSALLRGISELLCSASNTAPYLQGYQKYLSKQEGIAHTWNRISRPVPDRLVRSNFLDRPVFTGFFSNFKNFPGH